MFDVEKGENVHLVDRNNNRVAFHIANIRTEPGAYPEVLGWIIGSPFTRDIKPTTIDRVIFNDPATIVMWSDGTKTVVKCQPGDTYDKEKGLALCIAKKYFGNKGNFNEVFKKWISEEPELPSLESLKESLEKLKNAFCK